MLIREMLHHQLSKDKGSQNHQIWRQNTKNAGTILQTNPCPLALQENRYIFTTKGVSEIKLLWYSASLYLLSYVTKS